MTERRGARGKPAEISARLDEQFRVPLNAYFLRRAQDRISADELTREVFIRLADNMALGSNETLEMHVFRVASDVLQDWSRHSAARNAVATQPTEFDVESIVPDIMPLDERARHLASAAKLALSNLESALSGLPQRTREIFVLARVENVPNDRIGQLYGISESTVNKQVLKAIAHLSSRAFKT